MSASVRKYEPVVSLTRSGGVHATTLPTAVDRGATAFERCGTEPWPAGPRAINLDSTRLLLGRADVGADDLAAGADDAAAFGEAELGVDGVEVLVDHELRADLGRALFAGLREEDDVAIERRRSTACSISTSIRLATRLSLSSTVPRP